MFSLIPILSDRDDETDQETELASSPNGSFCRLKVSNTRELGEPTSLVEPVSEGVQRVHVNQCKTYLRQDKAVCVYVGGPP